MCKGYCNSGECQGEKSWQFSVEKATAKKIMWQQYYPKRKKVPPHQLQDLCIGGIDPKTQ